MGQHGLGFAIDRKAFVILSLAETKRKESKRNNGSTRENVLPKYCCLVQILVLVSQKRIPLEISGREIMGK